MPRLLAVVLAPLLCTTAAAGAQPAAPAPNAPSVVIRVATFNVSDMRRDEINDPANPRLKKIAAIIQALRPNVILLNEVSYDTAGSPSFAEGDTLGVNAQRFVDGFLAVSQGPNLAPIRYRGYMLPTNTGVSSGADLNNDGKVVTEYRLPPASRDGRPAPEDLAYAGDCYGFGTFPGHYGMALLVDPRFKIREDQVRTFRLLPWDYVDGAMLPQKPDGTPWYSPEQRKLLRLSSKSHWDVPIELPGGSVVRFLCSHPTPPVFDGPEKRNARRNHDEIRFWSDYIDGHQYIVDDADKAGGLTRGAAFVILGDLNADPDEGESLDNPIGKFLLNHPRIAAGAAPTSDVVLDNLDPDDTSRFKLRVDYVLPSKDLAVRRCGVWRPQEKDGGLAGYPSDHFPVWAEIEVPLPPDFSKVPTQ